ncbi:hypothetical protein J2I47_14030 [Fibrella sp. HMF5335]|uniref:Uncharacterized protein n=1 Tax=Fibrella rubiginis TaxID=2817060 RepID=A0A939K1Z4_9BACT|nr:hypothetical protein [Fibrella rubiginis]MBO0937672.1 hypothetical protein [Fibrella rubiginis]
MRYLLLLFMVSACTARYQPLRVQPNRLINNSSALYSPVTAPDTTIKRIRAAGWLSRNIVIKNQDGSVLRVPKNTVWGYSDKNGKVWRRYRSGFYQVIRIADVVEYQDIVSQTYQTNGHTYTTQQPVIRYSRTLDSPIYGTRRRALRDDNQ